jgi:hypothetical protein
MVLATALAATTIPLLAHANEPVPASTTAQVVTGPKSIEVCFVLDTTGSMSGLIEGAKRKIWSIANSIVRDNHGAAIRFALVPYRDRGDQYVTKVFDLTDDLDAVFQNLQSFKADGGGDTPESVNQALADSVAKISWSASSDVPKIVFLVGDAPPHMDYADDVKYPDTCQSAMKKGLIINTVQCGGQTDTRDFWEKIAKLSEGSFVSLEQSGGMVVSETPMDTEIAELSGKIGAMSLPYGSRAQQAQVATKNSLASTAPAAVQADRAYFNVAAGKAIQGHGDLISDYREKQVKLEDIAKDELPKELQNLSREEQVKVIEQKTKERDEVSKRVAELSKQREAYIAEQSKKLAAKGDSFDAKVTEIVQSEITKRGK